MQLEDICDEIIVKEAAKRLVSMTKRKTGNDIRFGTFTITIHNNLITTIDFNYRDRCLDFNPEKAKRSNVYGQRTKK
jgi:hypothetical protein